MMKKLRLEYKIAVIAAVVALLSIPVSLYNIMGIYGIAEDDNSTQAHYQLNSIEKRQDIVTIVTLAAVSVSATSGVIGLYKNARKKPSKKS